MPGIHRSPANSPHKGQWCGALMFSVICSWTNRWVNNQNTGDLRWHHAHYDVTVMCLLWPNWCILLYKLNYCSWHRIKMTINHDLVIYSRSLGVIIWIDIMLIIMSAVCLTTEIRISWHLVQCSVILSLWIFCTCCVLFYLKKTFVKLKFKITYPCAD